MQVLQDRVFENVEDRNPESAGRFHADFHADFLAVILVKPERQLLQALGEGREVSLKVLSTGVCIGNADTGILLIWRSPKST